MVSIDLKRLFTNIPADFVTEIILEEIYGSDSTKKVYGLTKRQFKNLLVWTTKCTTLNFNGSFYEQADGVAIDSPIAVAFADIFMNYMWLRKQKSLMRNRSYFFDMCMIAFQYSQTLKSVMLFFRKLNKIYNNVKFTYELESNEQLPFLHVNVDNSKEKLELSIGGQVNAKR